MIRTVKPADLRIGDELAHDSTDGSSWATDGVCVIDVHPDEFGIWVEWSDGDSGYLDNRVLIYRED